MNLTSILRWCFLLLMHSYSTSEASGITREAQGSAVLSRGRRQLLFPNSTLLQFNAGVAVPTPVQNRTINVNWAFQANFQLPWNRTQVPTDILLVGPGYTAQARASGDLGANDVDGMYANDREHSRFERTVENEDDFLIYEKSVENEEKHIEDVRYKDEVQVHHVYKFVEQYLAGFGHDGGDCVLRAVCKLAAEPLHSDDDEDVLHEILQYLLDPQADVDPLSVSQDDGAPYTIAQRHGLEGEDCVRRYPGCRLDLVDMFTATHQ